MELILFIGLQASGKSSFYRARFAATHDLISKDRLRNNKNRERRQRQLIAEALAAGRPVVVDNTNPTTEDRRPLIELAKAAGVHVTGYYFASRLEDCLGRNQLRQGKDHVPDVALFATAAKLQRPTVAEGFDQLFHVCLAAGAFEVAEWKEEEDNPAAGNDPRLRVSDAEGTPC
ncbi:MAG TPA: ATP-binding protein [Gemmataceae bacterium]|nr:ATP-binding protein [Gemmataceae bacterium]